MSTPASTEPESISVSIRRYVEIVRKRLWVVAAIIAVGLTVSVLYTLRLPKIYQAVATVVVNPQAPRPFGNQSDESYELGAIHEVTSPDDNLQAVFQYLVKG